MRFVVQSVGVALLATLLASTQSTATQRMTQQVESGAMSADSSNTAGTHATVALCTAASSTARPAPYGAATACRESLAGFSHAYRFTFYIAALALLFGVWLPGWPWKWGGRGREGAPA